MNTEMIIAGAVGLVVGIIIGRVFKRDDSRIVWSEPIDVDKIEPDIKELVASGQKIQAIKRYRELHKVGLKEAKDAIDAIEAQQPR